jgi:hypothetical protein
VTGLLRARWKGLMEQMSFKLCQELLAGKSEETETNTGCWLNTASSANRIWSLTINAQNNEIHSDTRAPTGTPSRRRGGVIG